MGVPPCASFLPGSRGQRVSLPVGAYQTQFDTHGPREFSVVYVGKGTARDYEGLDVRGKLVLADINQRDEWWINFPVYQAKLKGAAALNRCPEPGLRGGGCHALNAQDIAGPADAPAFSISRADAQILKKELERGEIRVSFDAKSLVREKGETIISSGGFLGGIQKRAFFCPPTTIPIFPASRMTIRRWL